ncbi:FCD domain-containing protein [Streptomyces sp. enrichment culture]|uniref:FCD domain-containing protein n=1 Tax=Streptomyces sp. enrichment culture TaxID=1795815 RepID=UPI003F55BA33
MPTVGRVARSASGEELEAVRPVAGEIVAAASAGDLIADLRSNRRFHLGLLALVGHSRLVDTVADVRKRSRPYGFSKLAEAGALVASVHEHTALLDLMLSGDAAAGGLPP